MKKEKVIIKKKRNSRSNIILDEDDIFILFNLSGCVFMELEDLRRSLNISHKGLLIHLNRLISHNFITLGRSEPNYKIKLVAITNPGRETLKELLHSPKIKNILKTKELSNYE